MNRMCPSGLASELGYPNAVATLSHEAPLSVVSTGALLGKEGDRLLRRFGLTNAQFNVLMLVAYQAPREGVDQSALGAILLMNRPNVTGLLDRLERSGWAVRVGDSRDRRVKRVRLTPEGKRLLRRAKEAYLTRVEETPGALSKEDLFRFYFYLEEIRRSLRENGGKTVGTRGGQG